MEPHLDPDTLAAYVDGRLAIEELGQADRHIDACSSCRVELSALAASGSQPAALSPGVTPEGAVGRYRILRELGRGSMGIVLRAYDPELQRPVALKLLRDVDRELLRREARALAKLRHPNVVSVYDAISDGDAMYVAMELVEGTTMRAFCKGRPASEILAACIAAGRGLAAAHDAGVIHRDFKPENVLCTPGGEVRVSDFGLARGADEADGHFAGTPAYMAPEVLAHKPATALSDQYSYCVTVYEMLEGARPAHTPPTKIASWVWRVLRKGLSPSPGMRFSTMHALLYQLAADPAARRKRAALIAAGALASIGIGAALMQLLPAHGASCDVDFDVWNAHERASVQASLDKASDPDNAAHAVGALDDVAARWVAARKRACAHDVTPAITSCLDRTRREFGELVRMLAVEDPKVAAKAQEAIGRLRDPAACAAADDVLPANPVDVVLGEHARTVLDHAAALQYVGKLDEAEVLDRSVRREIASQPRLVAESRLAEGRIENDRSRPDRAEPLLFDALRDAERALDDRLVAAIWCEIVMATGAQAHRFDLAMSNMHAADAALARIVPGSDLQVHYDYVVGTMLLTNGKLDEARERLVAGIEIAGSEPRRRAQVGLFEMALCDVERLANKLPAAHEHCDRGIGLLEKAFGPDHLRVGVTLGQVGALAFTDHDLAAAERTFKRQITIFEKHGARDHLAYALAQSNLGAVYSSRSDIEHAKVQFEAALALFEQYHPDHPQKQFALQGLAGIALRTGDNARAAGYYRQVRDTLATTYAPENPALLAADYNLSLALRHDDAADAAKLAQSVADRALVPGKESWVVAARALDYASTLAEDRGDRAAAIALRERALAALDHGSPAAERALVVRNLGMTELRMKRFAEAMGHLSEALKLNLQEPDDPYELGMSRIGLALALDGLHRDAPRALELAKQAATDLAKAQTGEQLAYYRDSAARFVKDHTR